MYERVSRRSGSGCAFAAVAHEMARIMYFMLVRDEPYRESNVALTERKFKRARLMAFGTSWGATRIPRVQKTYSFARAHLLFF